MNASSSKKFIFLTLPRMGTKHVQDQLVRALGATDHVEGHETFVYKNREFRFSLGEYFRNYGFVDNVVSNTYFENGELRNDFKLQFIKGLPPNCYAYHLAYNGRWHFERRNYVNHYPIGDADFVDKLTLLKNHGRSYVVKVLFNQHSIAQLDQVRELTDNIVGYLKGDIVNWICSYSLISQYMHSDPASIEPIEVNLARADSFIESVRGMIDFCRTRQIPVIVNRGEDLSMFGCKIKNFVTQEFSRFRYPAIIKNYREVVALVASKQHLFNGTAVLPERPEHAVL